MVGRHRVRLRRHRGKGCGFVGEICGGKKVLPTFLERRGSPLGTQSTTLKVLISTRETIIDTQPTT